MNENKNIVCEIKKTLIFSLYILFSVIIFAYGNLNQKNSATRTIADIDGKVIEIPQKIEKVSCLDVLSYSIMIMLGEADKVVSMQINSSRAPWVDRVRPAGNIILLNSVPSMEDLLNQKVDIVIGGYGGVSESDQMKKLGIPQVKSQPIGLHCKNAFEFAQSQKQMVMVIAQIMGQAAIKRAQDWCNWYDEKVRFVTSRTDTIQTNNRPKAYFARGPSPLNTHRAGGSSVTYWYGEMAGGYMVVKDGNQNGSGLLSIEEIIKWNPEVVFVGRQNPIELITKDSQWKDIRAVRENKVIAMPGGVFYWDGGPESSLLMLFLAKKLHPKLFPNLDLQKEVKTYYHQFYKCNLSDKEADQLLKGLAFNGTRSNPWRI